MSAASSRSDEQSGAEALLAEALDAGVRYWTDELKGSEPLDMPTDAPRPASQSGKRGQTTFFLDAQASHALVALSEERGVSIFTVLTAGLSVLLGRMSGQADVVLGVPASSLGGQQDDGSAWAPTDFKACRVDLSADPSFAELLHQVSETCLRASESVGLQSDPSRAPLFQAVLSLDSGPVGGANPQLGGFSGVDLWMSLRATNNVFEGTLSYSTDLWELASMTRLIERFERVLMGAVQAPSGPVSSLPLLSESELSQVLVEWNDTAISDNRAETLPALLEEQVERNGGNVAVVFGDESLTYSELNAQANQLARRLLRLGVAPDVKVGVCLERGLRVPVALLAIMKAGGAYLPFDPGYPPERLLYMAEDAQLEVLITTADVPNPGFSQDITVVDLDAIRDELLLEPRGDLSGSAEDVGLHPENLAYVIYTSGSTGRPKGACATQRGAAALARASGYADAEGQVVLHTAPLAFDASTFDFWWPLTRGKTVVCAPDRVPTPGSLAKWCQRYHVDTVFLTKALFDVTVSEQPEALENLRTVLTGGDAASAGSMLAFKKHCPNVRLEHMYGPTECTTFSTSGTVEGVKPDGLVPIGKPIEGWTTYVLSPEFHPVPVGVNGELVIGGVGLVRGYLGRPELTAERFVPDPAGPPGARVYRTGDLVRWRDTGELEFVARTDQQVKLRGFRIELGEIEFALEQCEGVRQCAVIAREDSPGGKRLVAYVVLDSHAPTPSELRAHIGSSLPDYMVPAAFVQLAALPLTGNGKVDRRALPPPEAPETETEAYVAPASEAARILSDIWQEVLGVQRVGTADNFFALGGDSILSIRVVTRAAKAGFEITPRAMFLHPTLAELAETAKPLQSGAPLMERMPRDGSVRLPLSFGQERLWFLDQLEPGKALYNLPFAFRLSGALDVGALSQALTWLVSRHESLRTVFAKDEDGRSYQVIRPPDSWPELAVVSGLKEQETDGWAKAFASRPFDLANGPLFRAELLELGAGEHTLLLNMHHMVSDGWSMGVMLKELKSAYQAFSEQSAPPDVPALPVQCADYAAFEREWLSGERLSGQLSYWVQKLKGVEPLELPTDKPRPLVQSTRGARIAFTLERETTEALEQLALEHDGSLYMVLSAALAVLLGRMTGQTDVVIGSPVANRERRETEDLIGFFVNTLALRADLSGSPTFVQLLSQVRHTCLEAYDHQSAPFDKVAGALGLTRDRSRSPVFQVLLALHNVSIGQLELGDDMVVSPMAMETGAAQFDLSLALSPTKDGLVGTLEYCTDLFEQASVERMAEHLQILLRGVAADPSQAVAELPLLSASEQRRLLVEWNDTEAPLDAPRTLPDLFEAQVKRTPDQTAVVFGEERLTYRELNAQANRLAHTLLSLGVGPEQRVGVSLERGLEIPIALLGIMKAGGAYVPLDPNYPSERLSYMTEDSGLRLLLTTEGPAHFPWARGVVQVRIRVGEASGGDLLVDNPRRALQPDNVAYVIYTSGSTGRPKGVEVTHRGASNVTLSEVQVLGHRAGDCVLQFASYAFDASVTQLFAPLFCGASVYIAAESERKSPEALRHAIERNGLCVAHLPPVIAEALDPQVHLHTLMVGGEACDAALPARFSEKTTVINSYGPTEASVTVTYARCDKTGRPPPIGAANANTLLYVLSEGMTVCPIGVPGELYVGGEQLARGYLGRPGVTAERFLPNPFGPSGSRLYRTGDRVRFRNDGNLEFLGRLDDQVKIRGFRIELGEVESALGMHPDVTQCAVVARAEAGAPKRLVAYVVAKAQTLSVEALRAYLGQSLPDYMVPAAFVFLDELPITGNGKVDRKALPAPLFDRTALVGAYVAPRNDTERAVAEIWEQVLGAPRVGVHDNFFELGGDSVLTIQVVARASAAGFPCTPEDLFQNQTVAKFSAFVSGAEEDASAPESLRIDDDLWLHDAIPLAEPVGDGTLLTGATGFVGIHLLDELLKDPEQHVICLVRAPSASAGLCRLKEAARTYGLADLPFDRVTVFPGDLDKPRLGLEPDAFIEIANSVAAVAHTAARVNHALPYVAHRHTNVDATREIIRLCMTGGAKLHYVSTLSAFDPRTLPGVQKIPESAAPHPRGDWPGYPLSKWVGEHLVELAAEQGLRARILRLGLVAGHSERGMMPVDNYRFSQEMRGELLTGLAPARLRQGLTFTPVDFAARALVAAMGALDGGGGYFHIEHSGHLSLEEVLAVFSSTGHPLSMTTEADWLQKVHELASQDPGLRYFDLVPGGLPGDEASVAPTDGDSGGESAVFEHGNMSRALSEAAVPEPSLKTALRNMVSYLEEPGDEV